MDALLERRAEVLARWVVWPTERLLAMKPPERRPVSIEEYHEMRRLTDEGPVAPGGSPIDGRPKSTVTQMLAPGSGRARRLGESDERRREPAAA